MEKLTSLLSELLRPTRLAELTIPETLIRSFERMVSTRSPMNMVLYGKPGIGKTTAARILLKEISADVLELNGSLNSGTRPIVHTIDMFSRSFSLTGDVKVVFIDEADYLNKKDQASLRGVIENASESVRFVLTANYFDRFTDAITSRCTPICFDVSVNETAAVINRMVQIYTERLQALGYLTDEVVIRRIVNLYFPDLRSIANRFQLELDLDPAAVKVEAFP